MPIFVVDADTSTNPAGLERAPRAQTVYIALHRQARLFYRGIFKRFEDVRKAIREGVEPYDPHFFRARELQYGNRMGLAPVEVRARLGVETEHALAGDFRQRPVQLLPVFDELYFALVFHKRKRRHHIGGDPSRIDAFYFRIHFP